MTDGSTVKQDGLQLEMVTLLGRLVYNDRW